MPNIGLCHHGNPIFGIVSIPVQKILYYGIKGHGSHRINLDSKVKKKINVRKYNEINPITILGSKSHMDQRTKDFIDLINYEKLFFSYGSSIKFMRIAEGKADLYVRLAPTMEWYTCASQIILEEAGGHLINNDTKQKLVYNKEDLHNPYFIAHNNLNF